MIRIATLNLYHWAEPGIWWYAREEGARHSEEGWAAKQIWLRGLLAQMDADLVGFQEVVSVEALKALCAESGYPHFAIAGEPVVEGADPEDGVYVRPVQAVASRLPFEATAFRAPEGFAESAGLAPDWGLRRPAVQVVVFAPNIGEVLVYVCHLKSKGAAPKALRFKEETPWEERVRETLTATSRGHLSAVGQRAAEASALYHEAVARIAEAPDRPVIVMGDLNDDPYTPALEAIAATRSPREIGDTALEECPPETADLVERYRLFDAWRLLRRDPLRDGRPATHAGGASRSVIDFILVSRALHPDYAEGRVSVVDGAVFDAHLYQGDAASSSDHAGVMAVIAPRS